MSVKYNFSLNGIPLIRIDISMSFNGFSEQVKAVDAQNRCGERSDYL